MTTELTIKIDKDEMTREEIATFLEYVANEVREGYWKGEGWTLEGGEK